MTPADNDRIVSLVEQLAAQSLGGEVAPRQRIERRHNARRAKSRGSSPGSARASGLFDVDTAVHGRLFRDQFGHRT